MFGTRAVNQFGQIIMSTSDYEYVCVCVSWSLFIHKVRVETEKVKTLRISSVSKED